MATAITPRDGLDPASAERRLKEHFGVATLESFGSFAHGDRPRAPRFSMSGKDPDRAASCPATAEPGLGRGDPRDRRGHPSEPRADPNSGRRAAGSLLATIDCTVTPGGARLLAERLAGPPHRRRRHSDAAGFGGFLAENGDLRERLRLVLKRSPDARALSRLGLGRGGPRDLACLRDALFAARDLGSLVAPAPSLPSRKRPAGCSTIDTSAADELAAALADDLRS